MPSRKREEVFVRACNGGCDRFVLPQAEGYPVGPEAEGVERLTPPRAAGAPRNLDPYAPKDDLPKLYGAVATGLKLAPDQHRDVPIKAILGGAMTLVNGLGTLRNRFSDAHADDPPTEERPRVRPSPRHASLAVNAAGAIATFLVETYQERGKG